MSDTKIQINVNDQPIEVPLSTNVTQLLTVLKIQSPAVAVEINAQLCPRSEFHSTQLQPGDELEIVTLVGGG